MHVLVRRFGVLAIPAAAVVLAVGVSSASGSGEAYKSKSPQTVLAYARSAPAAPAYARSAPAYARHVVAVPAYARGIHTSAAALPAAAGTFVSCSIPIGSSGIVRVTANFEQLFQSGHISTAVAEMNNTTRGIDMITNNVVDANGVLHGQGGQRGPGSGWAWRALDTLKASTHVNVVVRATSNHRIGGRCDFTPYSAPTIAARSLTSPAYARSAPASSALQAA